MPIEQGSQLQHMRSSWMLLRSSLLVAVTEAAVVVER
jgi:hypothetical protein